jgi:hypothetical protein
LGERGEEGETVRRSNNNNLIMSHHHHWSSKKSHDASISWPTQR